MFPPKDGLIFDLGVKASDIIYVCRWLDSPLVSITSDSVFDIEFQTGGKIYDYDRIKLTEGDLVCRLKKITDPDNVTLSHFSVFSLVANGSSYQVTLTTPLVGLDNTYMFELVNGFNIYEEGLVDNDLYPSQYGCIKKINPTDTAKVEVLPLDFPNFDVNPPDKLSVWFYQLDDVEFRSSWSDNITKYGMNFKKEEWETPITQSQYDSIILQAQKMTEPLSSITFTSNRPDLLSVGENIPVVLGSGIINVTNLLVQSAKYKFISNDGVNGKGTIEQNITLGLVREELQDLLKNISKKASKTVNQRIIPTIQDFTVSMELSIY
jgi:hypothetical protein